MPRRSLGARLYLDPERRTWVIRHGMTFIRTGLAEAEREQAEKALARYADQATPLTPPTRKYLTIRFHLAKNRGLKDGRGFSLTMHDLYDLGDQQRWKCALTQLPFDCSGRRPWGNPYALSIDRIDCSLGYTRENVRLILHGLNVALNSWGERDYAIIAQAYLETLRGGIGHEPVPQKINMTLGQGVTKPSHFVPENVPLMISRT